MQLSKQQQIELQIHRRNFILAHRKSEVSLWDKSKHLRLAIELGGEDEKKHMKEETGRSLGLMSIWVAGGMMFDALQSYYADDPAVLEQLNDYKKNAKPSFSHFVSLWYFYQNETFEISLPEILALLSDAESTSMSVATMKQHVQSNYKDEQAGDVDIEREIRSDISSLYFTAYRLGAIPQVSEAIRMKIGELTALLENDYSYLTNKEAN